MHPVHRGIPALVLAVLALASAAPARGAPEPATGISFLDRVDIGRGDRQACPGDSIAVRLSGTLPDDCTEFARVDIIPRPPSGPTAAPPLLNVVFAHHSCLGRPCLAGPIPWSATVKIPPLPPGGYVLPLQAIDLDLCPQPADTTRLGTGGFPFAVLQTCDPVGCLFPGWEHPDSGARCDAFVGPGREAGLTFEIGTEVALAGLQGGFATDPPGLQVVDLEAVGPASGMHLSWHPTRGGARFVLFAEDGAPIPGGTLPDPQHAGILRVTFAAGPQESPAPRSRVWPVDLLGSDAFGRAVHTCPTFAPIDDAAFICRGLPCDFNEDGLADVRDLVHMARCVSGADTCDGAHTARFDCNRDTEVDIDDVLCCALAILNEAPTPPGGGDREAALRLTMGLPVTVDGAIEVPMEIAGDQPVGAARLVLGLPTEAFAAIGVRTAPGAPDLAVHQVAPGSVTVGLIRVDRAAPPGAPLRFTLRLTPPAGSSPTGEVTLVSSDFAAPDGVRLIADPGSPIAMIGTGDQVVLGPGRPNPFGDTQRIALQLPRRENADLAVFDLSGRRVRTLHHGPLSAGAHTFTWDGRDDGGSRLPGGVYFYRIALDGIAAARRIVMLDDPR